MGAAGLRFSMRSETVNGVADVLGRSGLVLLPADNNKVVEDFLKLAHVSNVMEMLQSLQTGAAVSLFDLRTHSHLNGKKGHVESVTEGGRVLVNIDGTVKAYRPQNLKQEIDVWGHSFTYTRA